MDRRLTYLLAERQPPAPSMLRLLLDRKAALEGEIAEHLRAARQAGTVADVRTLSALLRAVKQQFARAEACGADVLPTQPPEKQAQRIRPARQRGQTTAIRTET